MPGQEKPTATSAPWSDSKFPAIEAGDSRVMVCGETPRGPIRILSETDFQLAKDSVNALPKEADHDNPTTVHALSRQQSIRALSSIFDEAFGGDKGSGEAYLDWIEFTLKLVEMDEYGEFVDDRRPPAEWDFLLALGVTKEELVETLGMNPRCFDTEAEAASFT